MTLLFRGLFIIEIFLVPTDRESYRFLKGGENEGTLNDEGRRNRGRLGCDWGPGHPSHVWVHIRVVPG